jgi:hypothetical protein
MNTDFAAVPDWLSTENAGTGIAVADLDGNGFGDVVVLRVDEAPGQNAGYFRIGRCNDNVCTVADWTAWTPVPDWQPWFNEGAGIAVADVNGNGTLDLVVFMVDAVPDAANVGYYRVGWDLSAAGTVSGWSAWMAVPDWFSWVNQGADIAVVDIDNDGQLDFVVLMVDAPDGQNQAYYRSAPLLADGTVTLWRPWVAVPDWYYWQNQGCGIGVADLDGDGVPELIVLAVDNPPGQNGGYYSVGWRLGSDGRPQDGWGPWEPVPDWVFWENQGAAATMARLGPNNEPHLVVIAVDDPPGQNNGWYRVVDVMTDMDMAATMGVWRLLENTSLINPVHAALLHTGSVLFFSGSGNDPDRHAALQYFTAVWHYPRSLYSQPITPLDLFCCGHAFLPDGRLLAAGGTLRYDDFEGLPQASAFDPYAGPADAASPTGHAGAWTTEPDMAHGRWYPALIPMPDGRVLAVSGLNETGALNNGPEYYADGSGWSPQSVESPQPWPQYAHLFGMQDGRVFYSGGQYGSNNGVWPSIWDLTANTAAAIGGVLVQPAHRNQSASVLLPPAQAQQVMLIGGGSSDMHDALPATTSTAIADLSAAVPVYADGPALNMGRMHLCATLLPDRSVFVNGGAMMEESTADAVLDAEIYRPNNPAAGWTMAARSRVPRLYHSVALLMPDGKVITAGSNPQRKTEELRIEVYWPPYLFAGARPTCIPAQTQLNYGGAVTVAVADSSQIASAALLRAGATTHSTDGEQRLIDLPFDVTTPAELTLHLPVAPTIAPPGWYLLTVLSGAGVPSEASWVHLS